MTYCLNCGDELLSEGLSSMVKTRGRELKFCSIRCRVANHRRIKRYNEVLKRVTEKPTLQGVLVLELFPGAGLFGKAFEALGAVVVRGPDILYGGDIRDFKGIPHRFDGIIGGPPCQFASRAAISGTKAINLIPEFVRLIEECQPTWAVMENVREARPYAPQWDYSFIRDWDCGGFTHRRRGFWFYGMDAPPAPAKRPGVPAYSVLASSWNTRGKNSKGRLSLSDYDPCEASRLQGFPELGEKLIQHQPGGLRTDGTYNGVSAHSRRVLATHMLGNGVPAAMGNYIAQYVAYQLANQNQLYQVG